MEMIATWIAGEPTPLQMVIALIVLLGIVAQRLSSIREAWLNYRRGLSCIVFEKQRLEVLKVRYEIEALRKEHSLEEIEDPVIGRSEAAAASMQRGRMASASGGALPAPEEPRVWGFMIRYPTLGKVILGVCRVLLGFLMSMFALSMIGLLIMDSPGDPWPVVLGGVFNVALGYASYRGFRRVSALSRKVSSVDLWRLADGSAGGHSRDSWRYRTDSV